MTRTWHIVMFKQLKFKIYFKVYAKFLHCIGFLKVKSSLHITGPFIVPIHIVSTDLKKRWGFAILFEIQEC